MVDRILDAISTASNAGKLMVAISMLLITIGGSRRIATMKKAERERAVPQ